MSVSCQWHVSNQMHHKIMKN